MYNPFYNVLSWSTLLLALLSTANLASAQWGGWQFQIQRYFLLDFWVITPDYVTEYVLVLEQRPGIGRGTHYAQGLQRGPGGRPGGNKAKPAVKSSTSTKGASTSVSTRPGNQAKTPALSSSTHSSVPAASKSSSSKMTSTHRSSLSFSTSHTSSKATSTSQTSSKATSTSLTSRATSTSRSSSVTTSSKISSSSSVRSSSTTHSPSSTSSTTAASASASGIYDTDLTTTNKGLTFVTTIKFGSQSFEAIVDTGSSDTWVINNGFQCTNLTTQAVVPPSACNFGPVYKQDSTFKQIPNENFHQAYASGETLDGIVGLENVTVAGITVPQQEVGIVNSAAYNGDGITSGLLGLGFPANTKAYSGTNPAQDSISNQDIYNPIFTNMYTYGHVPPVFSIALDRSGGGQLAFGGLPPVQYTNSFASSPFQILQTSNPDGTVSVASAYTFYTIAVNGFAVPGASSDVNATAPQMIVDSGTTQNFLPQAVADAINQGFNPPATYDETTGDYSIDCNSVPPTYGVVIGGKTFMVDSRDMIINEGPQCISAVAATGEGGSSILGHSFLKNVVAVFDVGSQVMRFAPHIY